LGKIAASAVLNAVCVLLPGEWNVYEVECRLSNEGSDVRCPVCGQGFLAYWAKFSRAEQVESRRVIQEELRRHHVEGLTSGEAHAVHPRESFTVVEPCAAAPAYVDAMLPGDRDIRTV
jgi:hypothetical protein